MHRALENPHLLSLAAGFTDNASLPNEVVASTALRLSAQTGATDFLQYGTTRGRDPLRRILAERLTEYDPELKPEEWERNLLVTNGSQQALYLALQVLCDPGDIVLVDRPSYFVFLEMLRGLGLEAVSLPTQVDGELDQPALHALLTTLKSDGRAHKVKALYFVSYFSNPTGRSLSLEDKTALAHILTKHDMIVPVLEDAAYRELYYHEPEPVPGILAMPEWAAFPKLYLSTLTKPFATGLKIGYAVCSDDAWADRMQWVKGHHDFGSAHYNQVLLEQVLSSGDFDRQLQRVRQVYLRKMERLYTGLEAAGLCELGWTWSRPRGGLYIWAQGPDDLDTGMDSAFCSACIEAGVFYVPGDLCFGDRPERNFVRLTFASLAEASLPEAARRFGVAARQIRPPGVLC